MATTQRVAEIIEGVISREAGYVDLPNDRGGPTHYGITQARARAEGYMGDMRNLPISLARSIYETRYVYDPKFNLVLNVSPIVGEELIDTGVNMGPAVAATMFQRWLNGFNLQQRLYGDLFPDGRIGNLTIDAFSAYLAKRGEEGAQVMVAALNGTQAVRYLEIVERNPSQEDFLYGWMRARVLNLQ